MYSISMIASQMIVVVNIKEYSSKLVAYSCFSVPKYPRRMNVYFYFFLQLRMQFAVASLYIHENATPYV
jgi:hypothetical protein